MLEASLGENMSPSLKLKNNSFSRAFRIYHDANMQRDKSSGESNNDQPSSKLGGMRDLNL